MTTHTRRSVNRRRPAIVWAAVTGAGVPVVDVFAFDEWELRTWIEDRRANGEAFPGERAARFLVTDYNIMRRKIGLPGVDAGMGRPA